MNLFQSCFQLRAACWKRSQRTSWQTKGSTTRSWRTCATSAANTARCANSPSALFLALVLVVFLVLLLVFLILLLTHSLHLHQNPQIAFVHQQSSAHMCCGVLGRCIHHGAPALVDCVAIDGVLLAVAQVRNVVVPRPGQGGAPDPPGVGKVRVKTSNS